MPANKKHLSSMGQRTLKITAGIIGGYFITVLFHNAIGALLENKAGLIITSAYSSFIVWVIVFVIAFLGKNGWKIWGIYLLLMVFFNLLIYLFK